MRIIFFAFLAFISCLSPTDASQSGDDTVEWYISHFPPAIIRQGRFQGQGTGDKRIELIIKRTPQIRHEIIDASAKRLMADFKSNPNMCSPNVLKTSEREAYIEYSMPLSWLLPNGVITTRSRQKKLEPYLTKGGELRLEAILADGKNRIAIVTPRSFGDGIDALLKKYAGSGSIIEVSSANNTASSLQKLANQDEYDAVLGYAAELRYLAPDLGLKEEEFVFFPVAEQKELLASYMGCAKSEQGKRMIAIINQLYQDKQVRQEDTDAYRFWLDEKTRNYYDRLLKLKK